VELQNLHDTYENLGLVVLGVNCSDKKKIAVDLLEKDSVTFPNIIDSSKTAQNVIYRGYRMSGVPLNYIIDREGKVAAAWYGYSKKGGRGMKVLEKLGIVRDL
jgi:peroxiredoxin